MMNPSSKGEGLNMKWWRLPWNRWSCRS